jgi:hypothetical protein
MALTSAVLLTLFLVVFTTVSSVPVESERENEVLRRREEV